MHKGFMKSLEWICRNDILKQSKLKGIWLMFTKPDKNYLLNMALTIVTVVCIYTGVFYNDGLRFAHEFSGYLMAILVLVHLVWHFQWIKNVTKSIFSDKKKLMALIVTLILSIGVCTLLFLHSSSYRHGRGHFGRPFGYPQNFSGQSLPNEGSF
jgi:hypothetical protein